MSIITKRLHIWRLALPWYHFGEFRKDPRYLGTHWQGIKNLIRTGWCYSGVIFGHKFCIYTGKYNP